MTLLPVKGLIAVYTHALCASVCLSVSFSVCLSTVQTISDDLNASLATADELSREFNSLLQEVSAPPQSSSDRKSVV